LNLETKAQDISLLAKGAEEDESVSDADDYTSSEISTDGGFNPTMSSSDEDDA